MLLCASTGYAVLGDLNQDGTVDFSDFFIFADNFGKTGPPDTLRLVIRDTLRVEDRITIYDTTRVTFLDTLHLEVVYDTVTVDFVAPPTQIPTDRPDYIIRSYSTPSMPLAFIRAESLNGVRCG